MPEISAGHSPTHNRFGSLSRGLPEALRRK
jgi:hypothetical protein